MVDLVVEEEVVVLLFQEVLVIHLLLVHLKVILVVPH
jgi:hypothetical protein